MRDAEAIVKDKVILDPSSEIADFRCMFRYAENGDLKVLHYAYEEGPWYEECKEAIMLSRIVQGRNKW